MIGAGISVFCEGVRAPAERLKDALIYGQRPKLTMRIATTLLLGAAVLTAVGAASLAEGAGLKPLPAVPPLLIVAPLLTARLLPEPLLPIVRAPL